MRSHEQGWVQVGPLDGVGRRGLWLRRPTPVTLELCAGREGDDVYVKLVEGETIRASTLDQIVELLEFVHWGHTGESLSTPKTEE